MNLDLKGDNGGPGSGSSNKINQNTTCILGLSIRDLQIRHLCWNVTILICYRCLRSFENTNNNQIKTFDYHMFLGKR